MACTLELGHHTRCSRQRPASCRLTRRTPSRWSRCIALRRQFLRIPARPLPGAALPKPGLALPAGFHAAADEAWPSAVGPRPAATGVQSVAAPCVSIARLRTAAAGPCTALHHAWKRAVDMRCNAWKPTPAAASEQLELLRSCATPMRQWPFVKSRSDRRPRWRRRSCVTVCRPFR